MKDVVPRLAVKNLSQLRRQAQVVRCAEWLAGALVGRSGHGTARQPSSRRSDMQRPAQALPTSAWSVLRPHDGSSGGIAVNVTQVFPSETQLMQLLGRVRSAQVLVELLGAHGVYAGELHEEEQLPLGWKAIEVAGVAGSVWIAFAETFATELLPKGLGSVLVERLPVRSRVFMLIAENFKVYEGATIVAPSARLVCPTWRVRAVVRMCRGGSMSIRRDGELGSDEARLVPGVTVDLGELELELATLLALKAGSEIELEVGASLRAYLRCGSAQLAVAEVELNPNAMVLKIVEVLA